MQRLLITTLLAVAGCNLDLDSAATRIVVTGQESDTDVTICAGPRGLLSCNTAIGFQVSAGGVEEPATESIFSFGSLDASFATNAADTSFVVTSEHGDVATATLPPPFELAGPDPERRVSRNADIQLRWTPSGTDRMSYTAAVRCDTSDEDGDEVDVDDTGEAIVSLGDLAGDTTGRCTGNITMTRTRDGITDRGFPDGLEIIGQQVRVLVFGVGQ